MTIDATLARPDENERLRTAAYLFAEMKRIALPVVENGVVRFACVATAAEFRSYWGAFRCEQRSWHGFRDI